MAEYEHQHSLSNKALRKQYEDAGFGGRVGWGQRPALLVIDMAKAWIDRDEQLGANVDTVLNSILKLLETVRGYHNIPIIFTTMAYDPSLLDAGPVVRRKTPHSELMIQGADRVQLAPQLDRRTVEPLVEKPRASAFFATNLLSMLVGASVDTVIVVGVSTSGCIRSTCESAFNHNFHAIVPMDAVGDRSHTAHEAALMDIDARMADVVSVQEVLDHLESSPTSAP